MGRVTLTALLAHWRRKPLQLLTLVLGLALATALWSAVQAINTEARASYDEAAGAMGAARPALVGPPSGISEETYIALRRAGWLVSPVIEGWITHSEGRIRLVGLDPLTAPPDAPAVTAVFAGEPGAFAGERPEVIANPATAAQLDDLDGTPVRAVDGLPPAMAFADIGLAQRLLGQEGRITRLVVLDTQPLSRPPLAEIAPDLRQQEPEETLDLARLTDSFHLNLTAFGLLAFAVGLFIVHGAVGLAFEQRRPTFRTLRALGVPARALLALTAAELLILAVLAGFLGTGLGYVIAAALLPDVAATLRGLYGAAVDGVLAFRPGWWAAGMAMAVGGTAIAAAGALWKIARLPALAPARPRAWAMASEKTTLAQAGAAVVLALLALVLARYGSGLVAGFAMLGALLIAAALALPFALSVTLRALGRTGRGPLATWFWADTRQQLPGLSLALMALLLALAANIGVGTMVSSFRLTFTGWLDQRLASELYVTASDRAEAERLTAWLAPRTDAMLPIWNVDTDLAGRPGEVFGVADHPTYRDNWPLLDAAPGIWDRVAAGDGVLINEQLARAARLGLDDRLEIGGERFPIAGIYSDYGNPMAQALVSVPTLTRLFPNVDRLGFGLRIPTAEVPALQEALVQDFGLDPGNMIDQAAIKRVSLQVFERTFAVTGALNVLTLAIAGFAILTSLLTLSAMRLPQLAPVWAAGLTRATLGRVELLRAVLLAGLTAIVALPVGLLLAWVLLAVINVEAFGWRIPMHLFPVDWVRLGVLAVVAAALAGLWPAHRLARTPPADLIKVFANER
ncbi:MAG: FtsX-like permease family protein [Pseudomonadota bacterium]